MGMKKKVGSPFAAIIASSFTLLGIYLFSDTRASLMSGIDVR